MVPALDLKGRNNTTMEASTSKDRKTFMQMPKDKNVKPEINLEVRKNVDMEVDMINYTTDDERASFQTRPEDATVSSSSFGDTYSDVGNCESDDEVVSQLHGDAAPMRVFGGPSDLFPARKKRLTSHWRKHIQPLMWRCKWVELQIKKFQSQAIKYDKELEKHHQAKRLKYGNFEVKGLCAKSMPFSHDSQREKPLKRKIRKRDEESDVETYMSQHNLFSFFATNRSPNDVTTMDDDQTNSATSADKNVGNEFKVPDELLSLDFRDGYFLEQILWKVEVAQSQVSGMKTRLNTVMTENQGRFLSTEDLSSLESNNTLTCPVRESTPPKNTNGPSVVASFASELMKLNMDDDSVKLEETHLQKDVNEQMEQPPVASRKRSTEGILIYNRRAKKPQTDSGAVKIHPIEKLEEPKDEKGNTTETVAVSEDSSQNEQPAPKLRSVSKLTAPKNKKKRAARSRRKSGSSLWNRRTSG